MRLARYTVVHMSSRNEHKGDSGFSADRELSLLTEVQQRPEATQRQLSVNLGIALGMTNMLLHNLAEKGYVHITNAGWRRVIYSITPDGISRKIHLTLGYVHRFLDQYSNIRQTLRDELALESLNAESRIVIYGTGEFAELVYLGLKELSIEEIEVFDAHPKQNGNFLGMPIQAISEIKPDQYDRVIIATPGKANGQYQELLQHGVGQDKLVLFFTPLDSLNENAKNSKNGSSRTNKMNG